MVDVAIKILISQNIEMWMGVLILSPQIAKRPELNDKGVNYLLISIPFFELYGYIINE